MADETEVLEVTEIPLDEASMADFKKARAEGKEVVTREVAAPATEEEETPETKADDDKPKSKGGFQKRIDRLIKQAATQEGEIAARDKRIAELEAKANGTKPAEEAPKPAEGEPQREQFKTESEYIRALTRWEVKQEIKAAAEAEEREAQAKEHKEAADAYNKKAIEAQSRYDDWKEVMAQETAIPAIVGDAIVHTIKNGPDVAYYLGKHPDVCEQMMSVHPLEAVAMAVKISEQLAGKGKDETETEEEEDEQPEEKAAAPAKSSKAPAPIRPITGGTTRSSVPLEKMSIADYKKARAAGRIH